jgi:hypothetical protein
MAVPTTNPRSNKQPRENSDLHRQAWMLYLTETPRTRLLINYPPMFFPMMMTPELKEPSGTKTLINYKHPVDKDGLDKKT